jgi:predicted methyltransferase
MRAMTRTVRCLGILTPSSALLLTLGLLASACENGTEGPTPPTQPAVQEEEAAADMSGDSATKLRAAIARASRPEKERARDKYRHPLETLELFGIKDDMRVVEIAPGQGWYTAILAPFLRDKGHLTVTVSDPKGPPDKESTKNTLKLLSRFEHSPSSYDKVEYKVVQADKAETFVLGAPASADMVVTFRNIHGMVDDKENERFKIILGSIKSVLKKGGVLGVVEHRAKSDADPKKSYKTGYVPEDYVVQIIEAEGFKLAGKSEVNANPSDTKDYKNGVWALPPTLDLKNDPKHPGPDGPDYTEADRAKLVAIGESDRMTLKFVKQ